MSARPPVPDPGSTRVHWLYRPGGLRTLWLAGAVLLALTLVAEWLVHLHPAFAFEDWFGFNAVYGFVACVAMVALARLLGLLVKRPERYYARRPRPAVDAPPPQRPTRRRRRRR